MPNQYSRKIHRQHEGNLDSKKRKGFRFQMSSRYIFLIIAAFTGLACWVFVMGYVAAASNYPQTDIYQLYERPDTEPRETLPNRSAAERGKYREPCNLPKSREDSALCAQWRATKAAEASVVWAERAFWLSIAGTIGLLITLHYTRKSVNAAIAATEDAESALKIAERNADAAADQVLTARDIGQKQVRAYVSFSSMSIFYSPITQLFIIEVNLRNHGLSPARIVVARGSGKLFAPHTVKDFAVVSYPWPDLPTGSDLTYAFEFLGDNVLKESVSFFSAAEVTIDVTGNDVFGNSFSGTIAGLISIRNRTGAIMSAVDDWTVKQKMVITVNKSCIYAGEPEPMNTAKY